MTERLHFILNNRTSCTSQSTDVNILDYLRSLEQLTVTKEGCQEGVCGAFKVLLGKLQGDRYFLENCNNAILLVKNRLETSV